MSKNRTWVVEVSEQLDSRMEETKRACGFITRSEFLRAIVRKHIEAEEAKRKVNP